MKFIIIWSFTFSVSFSVTCYLHPNTYSHYSRHTKLHAVPWTHWALVYLLCHSMRDTLTHVNIQWTPVKFLGLIITFLVKSSLTPQLLSKARSVRLPKLCILICIVMISSVILSIPSAYHGVWYIVKHLQKVFWIQKEIMNRPTGRGNILKI